MREKTVLVASASVGTGHLRAEAICDVGQQVQVLVVAGRNRTLERSIRDSDTPPRVRLIPFGSVDAMSLLMDASDLLMEKSGGLITSRALGGGLPVVVPAPDTGSGGAKSRP